MRSYSVSETWSKILLFNATIMLVIASVFAFDMFYRHQAADVTASETSALPSSRDELKPFLLHGLLCVLLAIVAILASFLKHRAVIRGVFVAIIIVELCAVYTNRTAMHAGFGKCHQQHEHDSDGEELCVYNVHAIFGTATIFRVLYLALIMCTACKTDEAISGEEEADYHQQRCVAEFDGDYYPEITLFGHVQHDAAPPSALELSLRGEEIQWNIPSLPSETKDLPTPSVRVVIDDNV